MRLGDRIEAEDVEFVPGECRACVQASSLQAAVAAGAHALQRLECLARYIARPSIATQRLSELPDGRIGYELRHSCSSTPGEMEPPTPGAASGHDSSDATVPILEIAQGDPVSLRERRLTWAELMMRVLRDDVLRCENVGEQLRSFPLSTGPAAPGQLL